MEGNDEVKKDADDDGGGGDPKRARLFSAKSFRENLANQKFRDMHVFEKLCSSGERHQRVFEYFEANGSCLEILQTLEGDSESDVSQIVVFEILTHLILEISANYPRLQRNTQETCKYLLANYMVSINKMLGLKSNERERKVVIKLLTAVATVSLSLAKDVLMQVNFNAMNLEVLTKRTGGQNSVRSALIHFIAGYLVDNYYPTISTLLQKNLLLTSVMKGLQYDVADSVCVLLTALKNHVLQNPLIPKTIKMQTFSTPVIRDIVNLYNWRGPEGCNPRRQGTSFKVNEYDKSKVSECAHDFLLVLCTSHKFGVIFRDHAVGFGKAQNKLIYTVLDSLERPWEHSYAGELVAKICAACPELTKIVWRNLKPFLEPRPTDKWLKAVKFAQRLLQELRPSCIEYCVKELSADQLSLITHMLIAPGHVLRGFLPENCDVSNFSLKRHVIRLQVDVLRALETYSALAKKWLSSENFQIYKSLLAEHVSKSFPNASYVIANWRDESRYGEIADFEAPTSISDYLSACFDLFELYEVHCVSLLDGLSTGMDLREVLSPEEKFGGLQVKMINLFMSLDLTMFSTNNSAAFTYIFSSTLEFYCDAKDELAYAVLRNLLRNTGIFQGNEAEINVWINSVFEVKHFDRNVGELLAGSVILTVKNNIEYLTRLSEADERSLNLSPLILGVLEFLSEEEALLRLPRKNVGCYLNCAILNLLHLQSDPRVLVGIIRSSQEVCSKHVFKYLVSWEGGGGGGVDGLTSLKTKCKLNLLAHLARAFAENTVDSFIVEHAETVVTERQSDFLFRASLFWLVNFARVDQLSLSQTQNCLAYVKQDLMCTLAGGRVIFDCNPVLLGYFSPERLREASTRGFCTHFTTEIVRHYKAMSFFPDLGPQLKTYRAKLLRTLTKYSTKNFDDVFEVLEVFDLELDQVYDLLENVTKQETNALQRLIVYCLRRVCNDGSRLRPLEGELVSSLSKILGDLIEQTDANDFALSFAEYLKLYPHCFDFVADDLFERICAKNCSSRESTAALAALLFSKKTSTLKQLVAKHVDAIGSKKGLMLSLIEVAVEKEVGRELLAKMYDAFAPSIIKAVQKPQKAGQHFEKRFEAVGVLLKRFLPVDECESYVRAVQKYDVGAPFHAHLIEVIFDKAIFTDGENYDENFLNNSVLTFTHYCVNLLKKKHDPSVLDGVVRNFDRFLQKICGDSRANSVSYRQTGESEVFKTFCKFCLKFGISGREGLLKLMRALLKFVHVDDAALLMDMILSHSEFLEVILSDDHRCKTELTAVIGELCRRWEGIMERDHVPIYLAAYSATLKTSDRIILSLLRRYESQPAQTFFFDFKPFLWGPSAANHYSIRSDVRRALWRQPKMRDVLQILKDAHVTTTIRHHCLSVGLNDTGCSPLENDRARFTYDLTFMLPLFTLLLSPENVVHTNKFMKSGAFSLTVLALSNEDKDVRAAACLVLSRFYHHLEVSRYGKDNALLLRFVDAICKGTSVQEDLKLNNFVTVFLASMALILTNPTHVMYVPLSQYLGAKAVPNFSTVPELYTLLHSSDVNYKTHRIFILEVLRDGLRTENDFDVLLRSMSLKLIMELFTSCLSDVETQLLILEVLRRALRLPRGVKFLCSSYGLMSWLHHVVLHLDVSRRRLLPVIVDLLYEVTRGFTSNDSNCSTLSLTLSRLIGKIAAYELADGVLAQLLRSVSLLCGRWRVFLTEEALREVISFVDDKECEYLLKYGGKYVDFDFDRENADVRYYLKCITLRHITAR